MDINCPDCGHDIDAIEHTEGAFFCMATTRNLEGDACECRTKPSEVARALLTAEPAYTEVEAASKALREFPMADIMSRRIPMHYALREFLKVRAGQ